MAALHTDQDKNINDEAALAEGIMSTVSRWQEARRLRRERLQLGVLASGSSGRICAVLLNACLFIVVIKMTRLRCIHQLGLMLIIYVYDET